MKSTILSDYDNLVARVSALTPESARQWGSMTVSEMLVHLRKPISHSIYNNSSRDLSSLWSRTIIRFYLLHFLKQLPRGFKGPREVDMSKNGATMLSFEEDKAKLLAAIAAFKQDTTENTGAIHPYFGAFDRMDWARFHYLHLDHHLRQFGV